MSYYSPEYAYDDINRFSQSEKDRYFKKFEEKLNSEGNISGYLADVSGILLLEYAKRNNYRIVPVFNSYIKVYK